MKDLTFRLRYSIFLESDLWMLELLLNLLNQGYWEEADTLMRQITFIVCEELWTIILENLV